MVKRLLAAAFIFICTSAAWGDLGGTIVGSTNSSEDRLQSRVQSLWGIAQTQRAPFGEYFVAVPNEGTKQMSHLVSPSSSEVAVNLNLEYRQKGLLWYSTYKVGFQG